MQDTHNLIEAVLIVSNRSSLFFTITKLASVFYILITHVSVVCGVKRIQLQNYACKQTKHYANISISIFINISIFIKTQTLDCKNIRVAP